MQLEYNEVPQSLVPLASELPPINNRKSKYFIYFNFSRRLVHAISAKTGTPFTDLGSKKEAEDTFSSDSESGKF